MIDIGDGALLRTESLYESALQPTVPLAAAA
jgi:hypothetical protein